MATFLRVIDRDGRGRVRHGAGHLNIPDPAAGYRWPERVESVESAWQDFRLTVDPLAIDRRRDRRMAPARIRPSASQALRRPRTLVQSRGPCCSLYRLDGSLDIRRLINLVSDVHRQQIVLLLRRSPGLRKQAHSMMYVKPSPTDYYRAC